MTPPTHRTPRLRGHHLLCLHFFVGQGYSPAFVERLEALLRAAAEGEVEVCPGADDLCSACPSLDGERCSHAESADAEVRAMDRRALELLGLAPGRRVEWSEVKRQLPALFSRWHSEFCTGCDWLPACNESREFREIAAVLTRKSIL